MRDIILSKLREMMKPVKPKKPFSPSKKDIQAHGDEIQRREDAREPSDRDAEIDQMAKDYGYGKKEESKIAFRKDTIHGQAARKTAAETLKHHKAKQQAKPGATPRAVAKEVKQFSKDTYKQRESTNLKDRMVEALTQKLTESSMEFTYGRETPEQKAKNAARLKQLRVKKAKKPSRESNPEAGGGEGTKPGSYFTNRHGGRTEN